MLSLGVMFLQVIWLLQVCCISSALPSLLPVQEFETEVDDVSAVLNVNDDAIGTVAERHKRQLQFNSYIIDFYSNMYRLKGSNCSITFLEQSVSSHLCASNTIIYSFIKGKIIHYTTIITLLTILSLHNSSSKDVLWI